MFFNDSRISVSWVTVFWGDKMIFFPSVLNSKNVSLVICNISIIGLSITRAVLFPCWINLLTKIVSPQNIPKISNCILFYTIFILSCQVFIQVNFIFNIFKTILAQIAHNVPAVYEVFTIPIMETAGFQGL
jgi:hypothetical protein